MLTNCGVCAKIAYYNEKPAAQILFYPEEADPTKAYKRKGVLVIQCIYNPTPEAQKLGLGARLLQSVIEEAKNRKTCLGNQPCKFIITTAFNTGELLPLTEFYRKNGFLPTSEGGLMYLQLEGSYKPVKTEEYEPLSEDRGKAIIFYGPIRQFSFPLCKKNSRYNQRSCAQHKNRDDE